MFKKFIDPLTGREIVKLSPDGVICHHPYFYNRMFTRDSRFLVYAKEENKKRYLYTLDLESGESRLLIGAGKEGQADLDDFGSNLSVDDKYLYYTRKNEVIRRELSTGREDTLYITPPGWNGYTNPSYNHDNSLFVTVEMRSEDAVPRTGTWDFFAPQWRKKPRCRLVLVDAKTGKHQVIHEEQLWLGHPQLRPFHDNDISYCHEGPGTMIDARLWFIHADGTGMRCLHEQKRDEKISHEYWLLDGSRLSYVYRKLKEASPGVNAGDPSEFTDVKQKVFFIDTDANREEFVMDCSVFSHAMTDGNNTLMVGDGQQPDKPYLFLLNLKEKTETILCRHDTSWKGYGSTQDSHPHPAFSPDGKKVIFTSDRDGLPGIYMVSI